MENKLYIIGKRFGSGYPEGRYVCTKLTGKVRDHFFVKLVLDYPSVRAVANDQAWSNAEVYPYGKLFSWLRSEMTRQPEEYTGTIEGLEDEDYQLSLVAAIEKAIEEHKAKGDEEAVDRLREKLQEAAKSVEQGLKGQSEAGKQKISADALTADSCLLHAEKKSLPTSRENTIFTESEAVKAVGLKAVV